MQEHLVTWELPWLVKAAKLPYWIGGTKTALLISTPKNLNSEFPTMHVLAVNAGSELCNKKIEDRSHIWHILQIADKIDESIFLSLMIETFKTKLDIKLSSSPREVTQPIPTWDIHSINLFGTFGLQFGQKGHTMLASSKALLKAHKQQGGQKAREERAQQILDGKA